MTSRLHLAIALEGTGWHPGSWREQDARPADIFTADYWTELVLRSEAAGIDFVTIEDSFSLQSEVFGGPAKGADEPTNRLRGRLDALLIAARVAPLTSRIGLVPTVTTTHTEPFHVATGLQTLDFVSRGRAGWRVQASAASREAEHFGRRSIRPLTAADISTPEAQEVIRELFAEAADVVEVVRRLWDSWEDDAIIRDVPTGRFIDRERVHNVDFAGEFFSVTGASITPRSPQGQPIVTALAHQRIPYELAAAQADIVFVTPHSDELATSILAEVRDAEARVGREGRPLLVYADVIVLIDDSADAAAAALAGLDTLAGAPITSDALVIAGTAESLVELLLRWQPLGYDGFRLRPARLPADLARMADDVVPLLERAGVRAAVDGVTAGSSLRESLGFDRPESRYAAERRAAEAAPSAQTPPSALETEGASA